MANPRSSCILVYETMWSTREPDYFEARAVRNLEELKACCADATAELGEWSALSKSAQIRAWETELIESLARNPQPADALRNRGAAWGAKTLRSQSPLDVRELAAWIRTLPIWIRPWETEFVFKSQLTRGLRFEVRTMNPLPESALSSMAEWVVGFSASVAPSFNVSYRLSPQCIDFELTPEARA